MNCAAFFASRRFRHFGNLAMLGVRTGNRTRRLVECDDQRGARDQVGEEIRQDGIAGQLRQLAMKISGELDALLLLALLGGSGFQPNQS